MLELPPEGTAERLRLRGWLLLVAVPVFLLSAWFTSRSAADRKGLIVVIAIAAAAVDLVGSLVMFRRARRQPSISGRRRPRVRHRG